jgi:hypothetical protein
MTWPSGSDQSNKNEGAPDSLASWDAQLKSPPPKCAHNYLTIRPASWEWPRRAAVKKLTVRQKGRHLAAATSFCGKLLVLFANLFSGTLARQSFFHPALLARLQVVGVTLHFLNDVFRLNLALKATQGILQRLALLQSNFRQIHHPQTSPGGTN